MDAILALGGVGAALGLSTSAGLNAYIPLLVVALAARFPAGRSRLLSSFNFIRNPGFVQAPHPFPGRRVAAKTNLL